MGRDLQDGGGIRCGDQLPPHKYIRNTSTCGTTPTEHLLNAGRRPQTSQKARNSPRTWVGQKKKETTETKNRDGTCTSGRELWRRKGFHTLGSPFAGRDCGWRRGEASEPQRRAQQQGCGGQSGEIPTQRIGAEQHSPAREACQINNLISHLKQLEKEEQKNPKVGRRIEIITIRSEITETEMKKTITKINKTNSWSFDKINKIDKPLARLNKRKRQKTQISRIRMKKEK